VRLLILGASGRVGRHVEDEALRRGHTVTALVRTPAKLGDVAGRITIIRGDALDRGNVNAAVQGQDAIIYALGAGNVRHTTLFSASTRILLEAMKLARVRRLLCVTGVGAGDSKGHGGFFYDRILFPLFTKGIYADKDRQEALIRDSGTDWTIVRPASFRAGDQADHLVMVTAIEPSTVLRRISIGEVADFVLDELERHRFVHQSVFIGHP
jgi:putative NADH-flavin reductase